MFNVMLITTTLSQVRSVFVIQEESDCVKTREGVTLSGVEGC